jgi:hypothetical protein
MTPSRLRWPALLPALILVSVAASQIALARAAGLSPWKGGGFGMFSTTDDATRRSVRIYVGASGRSEEVEIAPSQEDAAARAAVLPTDGELTRLARLVVERERRNGRPVDTVRLQCWRITYARDTLEATSEMMREVTYEAAAAPAGR